MYLPGVCGALNKDIARGVVHTACDMCVRMCMCACWQLAAQRGIDSETVLGRRYNLVNVLQRNIRIHIQIRYM